MCRDELMNKTMLHNVLPIKGSVSAVNGGVCVTLLGLLDMGNMVLVQVARPQFFFYFFKNCGQR